MNDKKRRRSFFDPFGFDDIGDIEEEMMRLMKEFGQRGMQPGQPLVYGFNMKVGSDGKPVVQEFGNFKPAGHGKAIPTESGAREPLVDVIEREETITVMAEMPGVEKSQVSVKTEGDTALVISAVSDGEKKFYREVELPAPVFGKEAKAHYKNGVLEVVLKKREKSKPDENQIKVE